MVCQCEPSSFKTNCRKNQLVMMEQRACLSMRVEALWRTHTYPVGLHPVTDGAVGLTLEGPHLPMDLLHAGLPWKTEAAKH